MFSQHHVHASEHASLCSRHHDDYVKTEMGAEEPSPIPKKPAWFWQLCHVGHGLSYNHVYQTITHIRHSRYASL